MKILIVDEVELSNVDMHNRDSYPEDGLYVVNDGIANVLCTVANGAVYSTVLPEKFIVQNYEKVLHRDIDELYAMLDSINTKVAESLGIPSELLTSTQNTGGVSEDALLKALAIVQKPELIKDI